MLRRNLLRALGGAALSIPMFEMLRPRKAAAAPGNGLARRIIFFYHPDGVPQPPGGPDLFNPTGDGSSFTLPDTLSPLNPFKDKTVFFDGLSLGPTDSGSHPGGAKKLLTAVDGGNGISIDRWLAGNAGADALFPHVYLGAMANVNNASGDKYISYPSAGTTVAPIDDPAQAFQQLFSGVTGGTGTAGSGGSGGTSTPDPTEVAVVDSVLADLNDLKGQLGTVEASKLALHLEAMQEIEKRIKQTGGTVPPVGSTCENPSIDANGLQGDALYNASNFPKILKAQTDLMVQAMACGLTRVGVIQASQHTSELIMSKFEGTEIYDPNFDMRSHQASHYGQTSDSKFAVYGKQRKWFVAQLAYLLDQLKQRPEGDGTMLDYTLVVMCTEVGDGNTHSHDDIPFILAGGGGGSINTGKVMRLGYRRHGDLLVCLARAMGQDIPTWGQESQGPIPGLLTS